MPRERTAISNRENSIGQSAQKRTCWSKRSASRTCRAVMSVRSAISTPLESLSATALRTISTNNFLTSLTPSVPFAWCAERTKFYISRRLTHNCRNYNNYCSYCNPRGKGATEAIQSPGAFASGETIVPETPRTLSTLLGAVAIGSVMASPNPHVGQRSRTGA
jgi:hypothetical protein